MAQEIERKFLVSSTAFKQASFKQTAVKQGYLSSDPNRIVRIRIRHQKGYITIKGLGNTTGASRYEWEKEIPLDEAEKLLEICESGIISKTRYEIKSGNHIIEVDEFHGENQGLVVAEVELANEDEPFQKPDWLGAEVTGDKKYYNSILKKNPFTRW